MIKSISKTVNQNFDKVIEKVKKKLAEEGFGVITNINVKEIIKEKIGQEFKNYVILGACNPNIAYQSLNQNPEIGLFMPCNILIYETSNSTIKISIFDPMNISDYESDNILYNLAKEGKEKLEKVLEEI